VAGSQQLYEQALAHHRAGRLDEAATLYGKILIREPAHFGALHLLGVMEGQRGRYPQAAALIEQALQVDSGVAAAHANLGNARHALGLFDQALASYESALALQADHRTALMGQGKARWSLGRLSDALASYDAALAMAPDCAESLMNRGDILLALGRRTEGYIKDLFDSYAERFDTVLVDALQCRIPELLSELVRRSAPPARLDVLDIGCGTGLCGPLLRPLARRLTGIDLSDGMLAKARERAVYASLECVALGDYLALRDAEFDLVVAADVFVYLGDLAPVFAARRRALRAGGRFAFSVEAGESHDIELAATRRYRHSRAYLQRLAEAHGFGIEAIEDAVLRRNEGSKVDGHLALLRVAECR